MNAKLLFAESEFIESISKLHTEIPKIKIIDIDLKNNLLIIKGSVPGKRNSIVLINEAIKKSNK